MNASSVPIYLMSLEEASWGVALVALTMAVHGLGVVATLLAGRALQRLRPVRATLLAASAKLVVVTWILVVVHLGEVVAWGWFLWGMDAFPNRGTAVYYTLMQYTTVGSEYQLPDGWRLLGGMIAIAGLLTFALSTSVLFALAQQFFGPRMRVDGPAPGTADRIGR